MRTIRIAEEASGLDVHAELLDSLAPANAGFLWDFVCTHRQVRALHAMWTGPEISAPVPDDLLTPAQRHAGLPLEHATVNPQPGDIVLIYLPPRVWGGASAALFDIGIFYGPGARLFLPVGWQPGSVTARVPAPQVPALATACRRIREHGACVLHFSRA